MVGTTLGIIMYRCFATTFTRLIPHSFRKKGNVGNGGYLVKIGRLRE